MTSGALHYIHDPLCGWCYAALPLVEAVREAGVPIVLHGGGLWDPPTRLGSDKRDYIRASDARIAAMTGMAFGPAYLDDLLGDPGTLFWSRPTIAGVIAAGAMEEGAGLRIHAAIQRAHYVDGRRVVEPAVLADIAADIGLDRARVAGALADAPVDAHIRDTRGLMRHHGLHGYPSFLVERDGIARVLHEPFYGRPAAFLAAVTDALALPRFDEG